MLFCYGYVVINPFISVVYGVSVSWFHINTYCNPELKS